MAAVDQGDLEWDVGDMVEKEVAAEVEDFLTDTVDHQMMRTELAVERMAEDLLVEVEPGLLIGL